ncbi:MAG: AMP-binding protein [Solirubrobacteraceae bacterium]
MPLSYAHGVSVKPLLGETIPGNFERTVARVPDREALVSCHEQVRFTYAELAAAVDRLAGGLIAAGLERGDRVGIWSPNRHEWVLSQYAAAKAGAILVNVNPAYRTHELAYALNHSGCRLLLAAPEFKSSDYAAMVAAVQPQTPRLERAIFFSSDEWGEVLAAGEQVDPGLLVKRGAELDFDDPVSIQYTSGTTGSPKGATLTHHNILNNANITAENLGYSDRDRVCVPVPLYHCFGCVAGTLASTSHGACIVLPAAGFDPLATLEAIAGERCTSLYGVPTMYIAQLEHPRFADFDLSSLRTGLMAGSPCPTEVMKNVIDRMGIAEMGIIFGMTETSPASTQVDPHDTIERRCGTVGQVMDHTEIKIVDPTSGHTLPRGAPGEFCARGYLVMRGYWEDPERTAQAIDSGRWMHTGDLATMDTSGYVKIVGRIKDMIIRGGENVYPREVEEFLYAHPDVADVQVIGVPDERFGEELMAWIQVREGAALSERDLRAHCDGAIAHFKVPRYWHFVDEFPMTVTGKIQKYKMREVAIEQLGLQRAADVATA